MRRPADDTTVAWDRRRLLLVLTALVVVAVLLLTGLGYAVRLALVSAASNSVPTPTTSVQPVNSDGPGHTEAHGQAHRDAIAAYPMLAVAADDARRGTPAATSGPSIQIPTATKVGPARVPTGFPKTPEGAIGQLAAIETTVLQGMSIAQVNAVYDQWAAPGGVGAANWRLTKNVQSFLGGAAMVQTKDAASAVTATPAGAQVKGLDGEDWVVACVLLDVRAVITRSARMSYGYCERMQWVGGAEERWMIAPGTPPAAAPSTWPGTDLFFTAGWRTWSTPTERG